MTWHHSQPGFLVSGMPINYMTFYILGIKLDDHNMETNACALPCRPPTMLLVSVLHPTLVLGTVVMDGASVVWVQGMQPARLVHPTTQVS